MFGLIEKPVKWPSTWTIPMATNPWPILTHCLHWGHHAILTLSVTWGMFFG
jgi:hypothetical protein